MRKELYRRNLPCRERLRKTSHCRAKQGAIKVMSPNGISRQPAVLPWRIRCCRWDKTWAASYPEGFSNRSFRTAARTRLTISKWRGLVKTANQKGMVNQNLILDPLGRTEATSKTMTLLVACARRFTMHAMNRTAATILFAGGRSAVKPPKQATTPRTHYCGWKTSRP